MTRNAKLSLLLVVVFVIGLVGALVYTRVASDSAQTDSAQTDSASTAVVRPDSHRLTDVADGKVTFVEFLDFECEACLALFPVVEELRTRYGDRVSFVVRYFPLPGHFNAERAARAVEAAAQQGKFEEMYKQMFETQTEWGEQRVPMDDLFFTFAATMGLDMTKFEADYNSPATLDRIRADVADGQALGVRGTPAFFVNGERLEPRSFDDMTKALDDALR